MRQYKKIWAILTLLCFTLTFLPVAAFAKDFSAENCYVYTVDEDASAQMNETVDFAFDFDGATTKSVYVWFVKKDSSNSTPTTTATVTAPTGIYVKDTKIPGVFHLTGDTIHSGDKFQVAFKNSDTYIIAAASSDPYIEDKTIAECIRYASNKFTADSDKKTITVDNDTDSKKYMLQLVDNAGLAFGDLASIILNKGEADEVTIENTIANNKTVSIGAGTNLITDTEYVDYELPNGTVIPVAVKGVNSHLATNGVASDDITFKVLDEKGEAVKGTTVKLSTSNTNCKVNKETVTTDQLGQFSFNITITEESPNIDGFSIYMETGAFEAKIKVVASSTGGHDIAFTQMPQAPFSTDDVTAGSRLDALWIAVKDVNGNFVKPFSLQPGEPDGKDGTEEPGKYAEPAFAGVRSYGFGSKFAEVSSSDYKATWHSIDPDIDPEEYVSIISKPAGSKLENEDIWLCPVGQDAAFQNTLYTKKDMIAGDYTFKITLRNGKSKTIDIKVVEMGEPVKLTITPKAPVAELGSKTSAEFKLVDANGVSCKALKKGTDVAVNGNGVLESTVNEKDNKVDIYTKNDDKYAGSEFKIIATNDRYNLVGETTMTINSGKAMLICPTTTATVGAANDITYILMDQGKMMNITIGNQASDILSQYGNDYAKLPTGTYRVAGGQTSFVVVAKPEGATVNLDARAAGGAITSIAGDCYAVGRVESDKPGVVTVQMAIGVEIKQADGTWSPRYYEGTQNILFTDGKSGKNVIMSIGSNEAVINGGKTALDASPIIKDNRTFVPFRALAEAFGAKVAYDEATKAVTAELNGIKVVMTIGSATYTVDGKEKTADVAPYVANGRTMVPVRFAAEAFGSKVTPTYDEKGATADILFTL